MDRCSRCDPGVPVVIPRLGGREVTPVNGLFTDNVHDGELHQERFGLERDSEFGARQFLAAGDSRVEIFVDHGLKGDRLVDFAHGAIVHDKDEATVVAVAEHSRNLGKALPQRGKVFCCWCLRLPYESLRMHQTILQTGQDRGNGHAGACAWRNSELDASRWWFV